MKTMKIRDRLIGDDQPVFIIAEIGINHNGDIELAKKLIDIAKEAGCDAVKFQKRTVDIVYTKEELEKPRESPFGTTNGDLKRALEFGERQYSEIDKYCKEKDIIWFASPWDEKSVDFLEKFNVPTYKIASASLTDDDLLKHVKATKKPIILSTGMSTIEQIDHAVKIIGTENLAIMHCTSTYPSKLEELNLRVIKFLKQRYNVPIGYSGHEVGINPSVISVVEGARIIERHITIDRSMWGSDHAASLEPTGLQKMVRDIRSIQIILGDGKKIVYDSEIPIIKKLRRKG